MEQKEYELVRKVLDGDKYAFERIITDYQKLIYSICMRFMKNVEDAEDMSQEVLISVYKNLHKFNFESSLSTWIYKICVNKCLSRLKALNRLNTEPLHENTPASGFPDPLEIAVNNDEKDFVLAHIKSLNNKAGTILRLRLFYDKSFVEIGKLLNIPVSSVRTNFCRARDHLKQRINDFRRE